MTREGVIHCNAANVEDIALHSQRVLLLGVERVASG